MPPTTSWNEATPAGSDPAAQGDDRIREMKTQLREVIEADHDMPSSGSAATTGYHKAVRLEVQTAPSAIANGGVIYTKDVSAKAELHFKDEDGNEIQLTGSGALVIPAGSVGTTQLADGAVDADKLGAGATFNSAVTRYLALPPNSFVRITASDPITQYNTYLSPTNINIEYTIYAPIILPHGAVITKLSAMWFTGGVGGQTIDCQLQYVPFGSSPIAICNANGVQNSGYHVVETATSHTVDNTTAGLSLKLTLKSLVNSANVLFHAAVITYTVSAPLP